MKYLISILVCFIYISSTYSQEYWEKNIIREGRTTPIGDIIIYNDNYYFSIIEELNNKIFENYYSAYYKVSPNGYVEFSGFFSEDNINMIGTTQVLNNGNLLGLGQVCYSIEDENFGLYAIEFNESLDVLNSCEIELPSMKFGYIMNSIKYGNKNLIFHICTSNPAFTGAPGDGYIAILDSALNVVKDSLFSVFIYDIDKDLTDSTQFVIHSKGLDTSPELGYTQVNILDDNFNLLSTPISFSGNDMSYYFSIHTCPDTGYYFSAMCTRGSGNWTNSYAVSKANMYLEFENYQALDTLPYWHFTTEHNGIDTFNDFVYSGGNFEYHGMQNSTPNYFTLTIMDTALNRLGQVFYGGDKNYLLTTIKTTPEGDIILLGRYSELSTDKWNIFIMKVNPNGLITSSNESQTIPIKNAIVLPNPGSSYLQVHTGVYPAIFKLFSISGQQMIEEKINGETSHINTNYLETGTYIWQVIKDGQEVENGKWVKE